MLVRALLLIAGLIVSPAVEVLEGQDAPLRLDLNIPTNRLVVYRGDEQIRSYPISVGMLGHNTPTGEFKISRAEWNPWWRPPEREWAREDKITPPGPLNPMGRVKLFFAPYYFIHGTPDKENIGTPASHGCVRMLNTDVIALARLLHKDAAPQVTGAAIDRILARGTVTRVVAFRDSIPLTVHYDPIVVQGGTVKVYPNIYKYNAVHSEAVYQALIDAGYDVQRVDRTAVQKLVKRAATTKTPFSLSVGEAFGADLALTTAGRDAR